jgi:cobalt-zinc-cadmium efflux system protein
MTRVARLSVVLTLNMALVVGLVIVGAAAHSLAVVAEGVDYLVDAAAIGVSLLAIWLSSRPPDPRRPRGHPRATTVAALVNGGWLLVLDLGVLGGALDRLVTGSPHVHGLPVLIVSLVASAVMVAGVLVLRGDADDDTDTEGDRLNMRAVLLDTAADATAATGATCAGLVILVTGGLYWLDPTVAATIAMVVGYHALKVATAAATTLRTPAH